LHTSDDILQQRENKRNSGLIASQKRPTGAAVVESVKSEQMYNKIKDKVNYIDTTNKT
jgi:hypothetical protein